MAVSRRSTRAVDKAVLRSPVGIIPLKQSGQHRRKSCWSGVESQLRIRGNPVPQSLTSRDHHLALSRAARDARSQDVVAYANHAEKDLAIIIKGGTACLEAYPTSC